MNQEALDILGSNDPFDIFNQWLNEAKVQAKDPIMEATAMTVSTVDESAQPSSRVVLLKSFDEKGFVFFTNYESRKGKDLVTNPVIAASFYWPQLSRQVLIRGECEKTTRQESQDYWATRPRQSQLSQTISQQSQPALSRQGLEQQVKQMDEKFRGKDIPCPENWGGYRIRPQAIEFWIGRDNRLHDRFLFTRLNSSWQIQRLYP